MRVVYLDESGTGSLASDPIMVVAGVIVNADEQAIVIGNRLNEIRYRRTPSGLRVPEHLHAKDIFWGTRQYDRKKWPLRRRLAILKDLSLIPLAHNVPVVYGAVDRVALKVANPNLSQKELDAAAYTVAATVCLIKVEKFMRARAGQNEIASITMEMGAVGMDRVKQIHKLLKKPTRHLIPADLNKLLPITRIMDAPSFQEKGHSSILQLADYCAFALKRRETNSTGWKGLTRQLMRNCWGKGPPYCNRTMSSVSLGEP